MPVRQPIEEAYLDVLQNLEFTIVQLYRQHPEMTDWDVERAMEELIRYYQALWRGKEPRAPRLKAEGQRGFYEALVAMCGGGDRSFHRAADAGGDRRRAQTPS